MGMSSKATDRLVWGLFALAMGLTVTAVVFLVLGWSTPPPSGSFGFRGFSAIFAVVFGGVGVLIATRQPRNPIGWIALVVGVTSGFQEATNQYAIWAVLGHDPDLALGTTAAWVPAWIWIPATSGAALMLLLFPDGRPLSRRWRWVIVVGTIGMIVGAVGFALVAGPLENFRVLDNPFGVGAEGALLPIATTGEGFYGLAVILSAAAVVVRFRRSRGIERQQMKWLVGSGACLAVALVGSVVGQSVNQQRGGQVGIAVSLIVIAAFLSLPVAMAFAILRYRLYEIDVVIKKTVIFAVVVVVVTASYLLLAVALPAAVLGRGSGIQTWSVAIGIAIGLLVLPIRNRARRFADRVVYGKRATPYEVLEEFSDRMSEAYATEDVLPRMARILGEAVGAERARVWLRIGGELRPAGLWPAEGAIGSPVGLSGDGELPELAGDLVAPVRHQGELLGALEVGMPVNDPMNPERERLVHGLAAQAGLVLRNARLIEELRASRQRLVAAQDEERRKIERNIHDGAQQQLVALSVKLRLAEQMADRDAEKTKELLAQLQIETTDALEDLRNLARGIYPPLLADKGLVAALEAQARKAPVPTSIRTADQGRYGQDVEAAVYFCCLETLQNVVKHADASTIDVRLSNGEGVLTFEVTDDGVGFDASTTSFGTGLQGMADRLAALGGSLEVRSTPGEGTTVTGLVPAEAVQP